MFSSRTNNKGVCNMICTHPSFLSLSFGYLLQQHTLNLRDLSLSFTETDEKTFAFSSWRRWRINDNRNNLYTELGKVTIQNKITIQNF